MNRKTYRVFGLIFVLSLMLVLGSGYVQAQITGFIPVFVDEFGTEDISVIFQSPTGNIGIGTTNPDSKLRVESGSDTGGIFLNSGSLGTGTPAIFGRNTSTGAGVAILGEAFGIDATAVFTNFSTGDILRGFRGGSLVFRILNNGGFIASGPKSAVVETASYGKRLLYAMESPQNWFEDFGKARLVNGQAMVKLDPIFSETVNTEDEYHVFLTPKGDCKGLYVANQTATAFEVRELQNGKGTIAFDYRIVAKRKGYEQARLAQVRDGETVQSKEIKLAQSLK